MVKCFILNLLFLASTALVFAQALTPAPIGVETIVSQAEQQAINYRVTFNNLLAEETKIFEDFDKNGAEKERRVIESNFIVYQSAKNPAFISEYRNVVKVDGKAITDNEQRAQEFFEKVLKSTTTERELERIRDESNRYDRTLNISGLTLYQAPILAAHIRPAFNFQIIGQDLIDGFEVFVISYTQKEKSPYIIFNDDQPERPIGSGLIFDFNLPRSIKDASLFLRGKFWIDKHTFKIWREEREVVFRLKGSDKLFVRQKTELLYQKSEFDILTPKKVTLSDYTIKVKDKGREISIILDSRATFEYTKFSKSDVEIKSNEVNTPKN